MNFKNIYKHIIILHKELKEFIFKNIKEKDLNKNFKKKFGKISVKNWQIFRDLLIEYENYFIFNNLLYYSGTNKIFLLIDKHIYKLISLLI